MYIWERADWPAFRWDDKTVLEPVAAVRLKQGRLLGRMEQLGFELRAQAQLHAEAEEVLKNSEIEGEILNRASVRSSVARRLGIPQAAVAPEDRRVEAIVEMMVDATSNYAKPLTRQRLFGWHAALFPTGYSGMTRIKTGAWRDDRDGPMQIVSGPEGRRRVHFKAPPARLVDAEMARFLDWFDRRDSTEGLLRAAIAHLWFVTIHPFEDGNGRIARTIADMALAQSEDCPQRYYSISSQIRRERGDYYRELEAAQRGDLDITARLIWFLRCISRSIDAAETLCAEVLRKAEFWRLHEGEAFSERQRLVLNRFLDGFEGKLTARKWGIIGKCSAATAQRDIADLLLRGVLARNPGGSKNTSYGVVA